MQSVQDFGGAMNANLHMHVLLSDGVFVLGERETFEFVPLPPPEDEDILRLVQKVGRRVRALCEKRHGTDGDAEGDVLEGTIGEAMQNIPMVSIDGTSDDEVPDGDGPKARRSRRCASVDGFSIHANTAVAAHNRIGLEHLCRYGMRPPFSHERLSITCDGKVLLALRKPWPTEGGVAVLRAGAVPCSPDPLSWPLRPERQGSRPSSCRARVTDRHEARGARPWRWSAWAKRDHGRQVTVSTVYSSSEAGPAAAEPRGLWVTSGQGGA